MMAEEDTWRSLYNEGIKRPNPNLIDTNIPVDTTIVTDREILSGEPQYRMQAVSPLPDTTFEGLYDSGEWCARA